MNDARLRVVLGWHMHQPEYRDPVSGEFRLPWTYLHAIKDYADMAAHLERVEGARAVVNFAPLLLEQLADYTQQIEAFFQRGEALRDPVLAALVAERYPDDARARLRVLDAALQAHPDRLIGRYPAYRAFAEQARLIQAQPGTVATVPDAFLADLITWFHLAWMGETVKRADRRVMALIAQERGYSAPQRRGLLAIVGELVSGIVPRYRALAQAGKIELSMTPYGHPIVPLLFDFNSAREAWPEVRLPAEPGYPGGEPRAHWHYARAFAVFEQHFGLRPAGCWCSEGGVSEATLRLLAAQGLSWTATGQSVLGNSSGGQAPADRAWRAAGIPVDCFFRDDELSDSIGFRYATWHGDDAVADLVRGLEARARNAPPGSVVTVFLDGENAWEHFPANGYYFLDGLYRALANHPALRLSTFSEALADDPARGELPHLVAGSWVYGTFSTWIGARDKNQGWSLLVEAKQACDAHIGRLSGAARAEAERQLGVCEGSDWFWWLGDENPERAVSDFESLYRHHLARLYELIGVPPPARLDDVLSRGQGAPAAGGVMKPGQPSGEEAGTAARSPAAVHRSVHEDHSASIVPQMQRRRAGVLLHPTSLPGALGSGDLSHNAYRFIEFVAAAGFSVWQMLPVGPTHEDRSPYLSLSANAGNPLLISLDWLADRGWLDPGLPRAGTGDGEAYRHQCLKRAYQGFLAHADTLWRAHFQAFVDARAGWLDDYALFAALRESQDGRHWLDWPAALRDRVPQALDAARRELAEVIDRHRFEQFVFSTQWRELRDYAKGHGVHLFGDLPLFVAHDSVDVWAHRELFAVGPDGAPEKIAGVPPDYFAADGQVWGNPLYRWPAHQAQGFAWWVQRMGTQLALFDLVRIDHFRGLEAHWELPAGAQTAREGRWVPSPGSELLETLQSRFHPLPLVAENLGVITPEVEALRRQHGLPGMCVLHFGFDGSPHNPHLPQNFSAQTVVYTGTHDNATTREWYESLPEPDREAVRFHFPQQAQDMPWPAIHAALASVARLAVVPMQDLLELGAGHRMNTPGTVTGNWSWQFDWRELPEGRAVVLRELLERYGRT